MLLLQFVSASAVAVVVAHAYDVVDVAVAACFFPVGVAAFLIDDASLHVCVVAASCVHVAINVVVDVAAIVAAVICFCFCRCRCRCCF